MHLHINFFKSSDLASMWVIIYMFLDFRFATLGSFSNCIVTDLFLSSKAL